MPVTVEDLRKQHDVRYFPSVRHFELRSFRHGICRNLVYAWKTQHYWNTDLTLKVKHSSIKLSLLTKRGLQTLNQSWIHSQRVEKSQLPATQKILTRAKVKQMMIFAHDHQAIIMTDRVPCGTSVTALYYHDWLQKNWAEKCTKTDLTCLGTGHLFCTAMHAQTGERLWPIC
jgi:hypothetical protein